MPALFAGSTRKAVRLKCRSTMAHVVPVNGGTTDPTMMPVILDRSIELWAKSPSTIRPELVGRALAQRLQPPALNQRLPVEHADDDVRVADVNG